jgi:type I restriction enzyme, S subunit
VSELPPGWTSATVADLIAPDGIFADGDWVESKDQDPAGAIRLLQLADVGDGVFVDRSNRFVNGEKFEQLRCTEVFEGDVLIARMPDPLGRACLAPTLRQRCITVVDVAIVRPGPSSVMPKWLMHFLNAPPVRQAIELQSAGTTRRRISRGNLAQLEVPVPPLPEQKRVADKLDALLARVDACRGRLDRVHDILKRFRQSVLAAASSGELTREWREERSLPDSRRPIRFDDDVLGVPDSWGDAPLAEVLDPDRPLCYGVVQPGEEVPGGALLVRVQDLDRGTIVVDDLRTVSPEVDAEYRRSRIRERDVLVSVVGTIGRVAIVPGGFEGNIARAIARVASGPRVLPEWVRYWLESEIVQSWLVRNAREVARKTLNLSELAEVRVALPSLAEQAEIVRRAGELLAHVSQLEHRTNAAVRLIGSMTPSILAKAFRGELVPQDPNDEPAAALLERIRSATASSEKGSKPTAVTTLPSRRKASPSNAKTKRRAS